MHYIIYLYFAITIVLMSKLKFSMFGIVITAILSVTVSFNSVNAEPLVMDINKALDPGPGFGTEKIGTVSVDVKQDCRFVYKYDCNT